MKEMWKDYKDLFIGVIGLVLVGFLLFAGCVFMGSNPEVFRWLRGELITDPTKHHLSPQQPLNQPKYPLKEGRGVNRQVK